MHNRKNFRASAMGEGHFLSKKHCRHSCCGDNEPSPHQRLCRDLCEEQPHAHTCSHVSVVCVRTHRMHPLQLLLHLQDDRPSFPLSCFPFGSPLNASFPTLFSTVLPHSAAELTTRSPRHIASYPLTVPLPKEANPAHAVWPPQ